MKVLFLSPVFEMSDDPGSDRYYYFCKKLAESGHQVTVVTSAVVYKQAKIRLECQGRLRTVSIVDGINVIHLWSYPNIRGSFARRLLYLVSFMALAILSGLFVKRPDVIYSPNSPGMVGYAGYLLSVFRRIPLVFEVADVWPDAGIAMGTLTNPYVISLMQAMENACYRRAVWIIALTRGIKENVESKGYPSDKVVLVTNGIDPNIFNEADLEKTKKLRSDLGLDHRFVGLYLGAHGHYNSLWTIIQAANHLRDNSRFAFVLIGDGDYKASLEQQVRDLKLHNVTFLASIPRHECPEYLALADVFLLPNRNGNFFRMNLPNKLFDFLAASRPIVVAGEGETGDVVIQAKAGDVVPAEDAAAMAKSIHRMAGLNESERLRMGEMGRAFVMSRYNRADLYLRLERTLLRAAERN
jgi:glycosyltransferase involved in cell wall biosynthesis